MPQSHWIKDPAEVLDYEMDFAAKTNGHGAGDYLGAGETILSFTITTTAGIIAEAYSLVRNSTSVLFWLRGGTAGRSYRVTVEVITSETRIVERSHGIWVAER